MEYYRLWGENSGDSGTWDTDFIDIPADAPDDMVDKAIREAAAKIEWRGEVPVIVGCYHDGSDQEEDDDLTDTGVWRPMTRDTHEQTSTDLVSKAEAAGLQAEDFDETVHELANSISADINNAGMEDQLRYLIDEWGGEAVAREIERLAAEKGHATAVEILSRIRADCHSDDRVYSAEFDALAWFEQADDGDILKLAREDWGDGYAADEVGMFMADIVPGVEKMFDYLEHYNRAHKEHIGWTCRVNKDNALTWLKAHRPHLYPSIYKLTAAADC